MTLIDVHKTHGDQIYRWIRRYLSVYDALDARQELYYVWHKANVEFDPNNPQFMGWLFICTRNVALRYRQRMANKIDTVPLTDYDYSERDNTEISLADYCAFTVWWGKDISAKCDYIQDALEKAKRFYFQTPNDPKGKIAAYDVIILLENNYSIKNVAKKFNVHTVTIRRWMRQWHEYIDAEYTEEVQC